MMRAVRTRCSHVAVMARDFHAPFRQQHQRYSEASQFSRSGPPGSCRAVSSVGAQGWQRIRRRRRSCPSLGSFMQKSVRPRRSRRPSPEIRFGVGMLSRAGSRRSGNTTCLGLTKPDDSASYGHARPLAGADGGVKGHSRAARPLRTRGRPTQVVTRAYIEPRPCAAARTSTIRCRTHASSR